MAERQNGFMIRDVALTEIAGRIAALPDIVGVALGGSRARDEHTAESDIDLGLYYRGTLDTERLGALARKIGGPDATVTERGGWGPWVDGGGWLTIDGTAVDWIYRDLDRVEESVRDARAGVVAYSFQAGHPAGVTSFAYAGELAFGVALADPDGVLGALQAGLGTYPAALAEALVHGLWEADFSVSAARKAARRGDTTYVAGCLFRAVIVCAHAVHGRAGRWLLNEKGAIASAGRLAGAPTDFAPRAHALIGHLGTSAAELAASIDDAERLVSDTRRAVGGPIPELVEGA